MPTGRTVLSRPETTSGQRDRELTLQVGTPGAAGSGFPVMAWEDLGTEWASRRDLSADERDKNDQETAFTETTWQIPYRADMDPELVDVPKLRRVLYEGRVYDIRSASLVGWRRHIELITLAKVG